MRLFCCLFFLAFFPLVGNPPEDYGLLFNFFGPENLLIRQAQSLVVGADDRVYVRGNTATQIYNADGSFYRAVNTAPFAAGRTSIATDSENRSYIIGNIPSEFFPDFLVFVFDAEGNFVLSFDGSANGGQAFSDPDSVAVSPEGNVYVVDNNLSPPVQEFDANGGFLRAFTGNEGGGSAFVNPLSIFIDPQGLIYVVEPGRVQIYDANFSFLREIPGLTNAVNVATDSSGSIYVRSFNNVQVFDSSGTQTGSFSTPSSSLGGIGVTENGTIFVSALNSVTAYDPSFQEIFSIDGIIDGISRLLEPISAVVDSQGNSYVLDRDFGRLYIYNPDGSVKNSFDGTGNGGTAFSSTDLSIAISSPGLIYVVNESSDSVRTYDSSGNFQFTFPVPGVSSSPVPTWVAIDPSDRVYVADVGQDLVLVFDDQGNLQFSFDGTANGGSAFIRPSALYAANGDIYVVDSSAGVVSAYTPEGDFTGFQITGLDFPEAFPIGAALDRSGNVYVLSLPEDPGGEVYGELLVFDATGEPFFSIPGIPTGPGDPLLISEVPSSVFVDSLDNVYLADQGLRSIQVFGYLENVLDIDFSGQCLQDSFLAQDDLFIAVTANVALKLPVSIQSVDLFENGSLVDSMSTAGQIDFVNRRSTIGQIFQYTLEVTTTNGLKVSKALSVLCES
ncbi:MAG: NHL repeat-containing protein [Chlamydiota bacterium]